MQIEAISQAPAASGPPLIVGVGLYVADQVSAALPLFSTWQPLNPGDAERDHWIYLKAHYLGAPSTYSVPAHFNAEIRRRLNIGEGEQLSLALAFQGGAGSAVAFGLNVRWKQRRIF